MDGQESGRSWLLLRSAPCQARQRSFLQWLAIGRSLGWFARTAVQCARPCSIALCCAIGQPTIMPKEALIRLYESSFTAIDLITERS